METKMDHSQSEFNYAVAFLKRVDTLFYLLEEAKLNLDIYAHYMCINSLFSEISDDISREDKLKKITELRLLHKQVNESVVVANKQMTKTVDPNLFWALMDWEFYVREIIKLKGYKTKLKEDILEPEEEW